MKTYVTFKHPYILVEDLKERYQPVYKEYSKELPHINLDSPTLCCPFTAARRTNAKKKATAVKSGYCEVCFVKFDNYLTHTEAKSHVDFARNSNNYKMVDAFIDELDEDCAPYCEALGASSPCDHLAIEFSRTMPCGANELYNSESLIRLSKNTSESEHDVVRLDAILSQISRKHSQDK
ncbi:hypothetical protein PAPHI01_1243 [Pancytospora philotis]|nr:hypothetical protein PAPHI01_1235 [Pancytospora philotis]KAI4291969.1 hypothetical protein PAPHI01_1243 [Pancytospora philotis]